MPRYKTHAHRPPVILRPLPFIRSYLLRNGSASVSDVLAAYAGELGRMGYQPPRSLTFYKYFYMLRRAGLIRVVGSRPSRNPRIAPRAQLYSIVPGKENNKLWYLPINRLEKIVWGRSP